MTRRPVIVVHEGGGGRPPSSLRYTIDEFDARENFVAHLADLEDLDPARAAFVSLCGKYPAKRISLRQGAAQVLGRSDEPAEWMAAYAPIPVFKQNPVAVPEQTARGLRPLPPEKRPQDPSLDGRGLTFKTLEHGGEYKDTMPNAIELTDALGRSAVYVVLRIDGQAVDPDSVP